MSTENVWVDWEGVPVYYVSKSPRKEAMDYTLKVKDVAEMLRLSPATIYKWVQKNYIPYLKTGPSALRFSREEIEAWIVNHTVLPIMDFKQKPFTLVDVRSILMNMILEEDPDIPQSFIRREFPRAIEAHLEKIKTTLIEWYRDPASEENEE